jgi:hypothetical protein
MKKGLSHARALLENADCWVTMKSTLWAKRHVYAAMSRPVSQAKVHECIALAKLQASYWTGMDAESIIVLQWEGAKQRRDETVWRFRNPWTPNGVSMLGVLAYAAANNSTSVSIMLPLLATMTIQQVSRIWFIRQDTRTLNTWKEALAQVKN